jgi:hypothetical protein
MVTGGWAAAGAMDSMTKSRLALGALPYLLS